MAIYSARCANLNLLIIRPNNALTPLIFKFKAIMPLKEQTVEITDFPIKVVNLRYMGPIKWLPNQEWNQILVLKGY